MLTLRNTANRLTLLCLAAATVGASAALADTTAMLKQLLSDDTFIVAFVRPSVARAAGEDGDALQSIGELLGADSEATADWLAVASAIRELHGLGGDRLYAIAGLGDMHRGGGPVIVATVAPGRDVQAVESALIAAARAVETAFPRSLKPGALEARRHSSGVLLAGQRAALERAMNFQPGERSDILARAAEWDAGNVDTGIVFSPGRDFRRVLRELWPQFPPPLEKLRGKLADRWLSLTFSAKTQGEPSAELVLRAADAESAELFAELLRALPSASEQFAESAPKGERLQQVLQTIVEAISPHVDGTRVMMTLPGDAAQQARLQELMVEASDAALESSRRQRRMQQFKQMALAMFNYEDKYKHFPPAAIRDAQGRPLLSWRVAILPWIEERKLFDQFHLDEPWDSPHNWKLAAQMPEVYKDPAFNDLAREHKTTYAVPVGEGTAFDSETGIALREIVDGLSNTVMIVEVPPEEAVVWTKPDDWEVDMDNPRQGFARIDRDYIVIASCDGSAHVWPVDVEPEVLRAFLTRAGKEVVDWP